MRYWNSLTYKNKTFVLLGMFLLLLFVSYNRKIKPVFLQNKELSEMKAKLLNSSNVEVEINQLNTEVKYYDLIIGNGKKDLESINQEIISIVSNYCDSSKVRLIGLPNVHSFKESSFNVHTHVIELEGEYFELLKLANIFQNKGEGINLTSVNFFTKKDLRTRKTKLYAKLFIQNFEK